MIKNSVLKFIDSCVGSIARKIQDEFDESKHPRDKGGKFTSKGGEGRGGGNVESSKKFSKRINTAVDKFESMFKSDPQQAKEHLYALGVDADEADSFKEIEADVISAVTKNLNRAEAKLRIDGDEDSGDGSDRKLINTYKAGKITPERADALNEAAVALEEAGVPKQKILKMSNEGDLEGMQKLLESSKNSSKSKEGPGVDREDALNDLVDLAFEGFGQNGPDVAKEFFANMGMSKKEIAKFEKENVPDGDWGEWEAKIEELIRENPSKSVENMGEWADEFEGVFDGDDEASVSLNSLTGDKAYGPAVVNALQYHYDGDAKKVGAVVKQLNTITSEPDMWGEYTVREIIEDLEGRFGELDDVTKRHIDTYLRKTNPAEWASEAEYWKKKFKNNPGPHPQSFYE